MMPDYTEYGKGEKLVEKLSSGQIIKDALVNHGVKFNGEYEQLHFEKFYCYLGSTSRYIMNNKLSEKFYDGE